jgi:hypothetical protein
MMGCHVMAPCIRLQDPAGSANHGVTGCVAKSVVREFEMVDVEKQQGNRLFVPVGERHVLTEHLGEVPPIVASARVVFWPLLGIATSPTASRLDTFFLPAYGTSGIGPEPSLWPVL